MECSAIPARVIATCFALVAFAAALTLGWSVGNPTATIILYALAAMVLCWPIGLAVGTVLQHVNERSIAQYKQRNPMTAEAAPRSAAAARPEAAEPGKPAPAPAPASTEMNVAATPVA